MSDSPVSIVEHNGFTFTSNVSTPEAITASLDQKDAPTESKPAEKPAEAAVEEKPDLSKAASELGKAGGKAAAEKRAAEKAEQAGEDDEGEEARRKVSEEIENAPPDQKKKLASERVREAARAAAEAKRALERERAERAAERAELERLRTERVTAPKAEPQTQAQGDPEPKEEDFENYRDFVKAQARWEARAIAREEYDTRAREAQVQYQAHQYATAVVQHVDTFNARVSKQREADPGVIDRIDPHFFDLTPSLALGPGQRPGPLNWIADEFVGTEAPLGLMAYLTDHPDEMNKLVRLQDPHAIARQMAKLEARIEKSLESATAGTPPTKPEVSKANPPVRPVTGPPAVTDETYRPGMPFDDFAKKWNATVKPKLFQR